MKNKKLHVLILVMIVVFIGIGIYMMFFLFNKQEFDIEKVFQNYTLLQKDISRVEKAYLDEEGYVSVDDKEALLNVIESTISEYEDNSVIESYSREKEGVFVDFGGVSYLYTPPVKDTMSQNPAIETNNKEIVQEVEQKSAVKEILTIEPYPTDWRNLLGYAITGLASPDGAAENVVENFPDEYIFPEKNNRDIFLPEQGEELNGKSIIIWYGHGNYSEQYGPILGASLEVTSENLDVYSLYLGNFNGKPEMILWNKGLAYTPYYFQNHIAQDALDGSLVYLASCFSLTDERLADVFIEKGAAVVVGNNYEIYVPYNINMMVDFFGNLTQKANDNTYMTAEQALSAAREKHGNDDFFNGAQVVMKYEPGGKAYRLRDSKGDKFENISIDREELVGSWIQMDSNDPIQLTLNADGSVEYHTTISNESTYTSTFKVDENLWLNVVKLDDGNTIAVPYQVKISQDADSMQMVLSVDKDQEVANVSSLYGMDTLLEGTYQKVTSTISEDDEN